MRKVLRLWGVGMIASGLALGCMDRPVGQVEPRTTNLYVEPIRNEVIDKIDLLFMIDNSVSMGDKQKLLSRAVPELVDRLVVPRCVSAQGGTAQRTSLAEACPPGMAAEFRAVKDIHVAVITSSLGAHGAPNSSCSGTPQSDDRAHLLPKVRAELASYADSGFLAWDPEQIAKPPGEQDRVRLGQQFGDMVQAAGEDGCGFEASLEAWYRFLVDPEPPLQISVSQGRSVASGIDTELLAQRSAFLRPDSLVTIVMLTDENDCSIRDDEYGYYVANQSKGKTEDEDFHMPRASSACQRDPNDPCCAPCTTSSGLPPGCPAPADDPACQLGAYLSAAEDKPNLRCLEQKRRFGYDFLYPTSRYVDALTQPQVPRRSTGEMVENPLFSQAPGKPRRTRDLIYLAGIVGVPWQDIADEPSRTGTGLRYLGAAELSAAARWDVILGDPATGVAPTDPFMRESTSPRTGSSPITGDAVVSDGSLNPLASAINGHEQRDLGDDLQYACTFPLATPEPCTDKQNCDCTEEDVSRNRPLCQPAAGGPAETTQYYGKAYPGLRTLEVLHGIGDSAVVASICPKILTEGQPGYGYEPAVDAIVDRLKGALLGRCPPRPLAVAQAADGKLPCVVIEAKPTNGACSCAAVGRSPADPSAVALVERELVQGHTCGVPDSPACDSFCFCELAQAEGQNRERCLNDELGGDAPGYCYVDPYGDPPQGNPALVAGCDATSKRLIRFVGPDTPTPGATAFIACLGQTL